jgi:hypothetical protein
MKTRHFPELQGAALALVLFGMATVATASPPQAAPSADTGASFESLDRNGDGRLSRSEIPDSMPLLRLRMSTYDSDQDGMLNKQEFTAAQMALQGNDHPTGGNKDEAPPEQDQDPTGGG